MNVNKKALLCKIKKIYYKPWKEDIYVGYIPSVINGDIVKTDGQTKFEVNGTEYTINLKKVVSHTKNHEFIERVFTFVDENMFDEMVEEFVIVDVQNQQIKTINDTELWNYLCIEFGIERQIDNESFNDKIVNIIETSNGFAEIRNMFDNLTTSVVGQDHQIKSLLSSIYFNQELFNNINTELSRFRQNILIKGGTGTGKTETIKRFSKYYKLPITVEDATTYTVTGYVGNDVDDMLRNLYISAGEDIELAQRGIVVIDEFDKLSSFGNEKNEVKYLGVQKSLLKLLDGDKIYLSKNQYNSVGGFEFDTSQVTFIALGAFDGIDDIIQKRVKQRGNVGFGNNNVEQVNLEKGCIPSDFVNYGMMSQLIGRFSQIIEMNEMTQEILKDILLKSDNSILLFYKKFLLQRHIEFEIDETFIDALAKKAFEMKCGARGLKTILDGVMNKYMFDILSMRVKQIYLTEDDIYEDNCKKSGKSFVKKQSYM